MNIQSNLYRVASQTLTELPNPGLTTLPSLWLNLPGQIAQSLARLLLRMRSTGTSTAADRHVESIE
ncbi:hypothetical protein X742_20335 [Mesorhizobium sp. LNHC232B00]|nr:hypothetical protein X742_20335 [Mesorhizobium sp. LNHC232B00]